MRVRMLGSRSLRRFPRFTDRPPTPERPLTLDDHLQAMRDREAKWNAELDAQPPVDAADIDEWRKRTE